MSRESLIKNSLQDQSTLVNMLDTLITWIGAAYLFLLPLSYITITTEFTEYAKIILTFFVACLLILLWGLRVLLTKKVMVLHTPFNAAFTVVLFALLLTTIFSVSPFTSLFGQFNVWHLTLPEMVAFIVIFFSVVSVNNPVNAVRKYLTGLLLATTLVSGMVILNYLNVFDRFVGEGTSLNMFSLLAIDGFSPAGNTASTWFVLGSSIIILTFLAKRALAGDTSVAAVMPTLKSLGATKILVGMLLVLHLGALACTLSGYIPGMPARYAKVNQVSIADSWRIASSTIRDRVWFGTGPATYNSAYNAYRPVQINQTDDWATAYHRSGSEFLTWMTTTGMIGFAAFVFLIVKMLAQAVGVLKAQTSQKPIALPYEGTGALSMRPVFATIVILILIGFVITSSTVMMVGMLFTVLILWMLVERIDTEKQAVTISDISFGTLVNNINVEGKNGRVSTVPALPLVTGVLFILIALLGGWYVMQDVRGNMAYARSVQYISENRQALDIYNAQREAISYNPRRDAYRRAYANTNITTARVVAAEKGEEITDTQRNEVIQLIQQSLREVRIATELLNPYSAINWQTRGRIYQSLLGVANGADRWALQAFQQAVVLAPQDPQLRVDLGGLYFALATTTPAEGTQGEAPDANVPNVPETQQANLLRAISVFQDAARLKTDFAPAHFNLAIAYKEAGRNDLALQEFETTKTLLSEGTADYDRTNKEIEDLKQAGVTPAVTPTPTVTATPSPTVTLTVVVTATPTPAPTPAQ